MRTGEQRINKMHNRAEELQLIEERKNLALWSGSCLIIFGILLHQVIRYSGSPHEISISSMTGASLLDESVGGYLLIAILAFIAGTAITVFLIKRNNSEKKSQHDEESNRRD